MILLRGISLINLLGLLKKSNLLLYLSLCDSVYSLCNNNLRTYTEGTEEAQSYTEGFFNGPNLF